MRGKATILAAVLSGALPAAARGAGDGGGGQPPFRVRVANDALAAAVLEAAHGAARRLSGPSCATIFQMFRDVEGRTLQERLDELGMTGERYLALVGFYDGSGVSRCQGSRTLAVTGAGSRAVWICPRFAGEARQDPRLAEVSLLHEMLHSLGLGENPPSPAEITALVARHCGP